jgi:CHAD domain-containing protein
MAADAAASAVLTALLGLVEANLPGTIDDVDTEFLHDLRIAVRRSRAVMRELPRVFDPDARAHFATELRWLQQVTGPVRDLDIHLLEFDDYRAMVAGEFAAALAPVQNVLASRRRRAFLGLRRALRSERLDLLLTEWRAVLGALAESASGGRSDSQPDARRPARDVVGARINRLYRRMVKRGSAIGDASPAADLHELRKQGKELRYLLELFGGLYPADVVRPLVRSLKELQDVLGRHQDRDVQRAMLRTVRDEVAAQPDGVAALVASGALAQRLSDDEMAARQEFAGPFAVFASRDRQRAVKETFR